MRLSLAFDEGPGRPGMSDGPYDGLCARVDMDVLDNNPLLSAPTQLGQRIHLRSKRLCQAGNRQRI
jgi:hypothetical protein